MPVAWPIQLCVRSTLFHPDAPSRSGGQSMSGLEQVIVSSAGRWRATVTLSVHREAMVLAYRSLVAQLQGRVGTILVPTFQAYKPVNINGRRLSSVRATRYGNDGYNFDLSGWGQDDFTYATLGTGGAAGATQIAINLVDGEGPRPGHYFGIGERLHLVQAVWQETPESLTNVRFWPPLRSAATTGTRVLLDRPVCLMRLAEDSSGEAVFDLGRFSEVTLNFVEAL